MSNEDKNKFELLERCLVSLNSSNELLTGRLTEMEETIAKQQLICDKLKKRLKEKSIQTKSINDKNSALLQLEELSKKIDRAHEKVFNTAFTAQIISRTILELMNSKSYVWTNFLRYTSKTLFSWSLPGKIHFFRTVMQRLFLKNE